MVADGGGVDSSYLAHVTIGGGARDLQTLLNGDPNLDEEQ